MKRERSPQRDYDPPGQYWVRADRKPLSVDNGPRRVYMVAPSKSEQSIPEGHYRPHASHPASHIRVVRHGSDVAPNRRKHYATPRRTGSVYSSNTVSTSKSEPKREPEVLIRKLQRPDPTFIYTTSPNDRDPETFIYTSPQSSSPPSTSPSYLYTQPQHTQPQHRPQERPKSPSAKVVLKGRGLKQAELNKPAVFHVDGRNAGPGECHV